jgi:serine/threonine-protein kinase
MTMKLVTLLALGATAASRSSFGETARRSDSYPSACNRGTMIDALEEFMKTVMFNAGDTIISEGEEGATAFFIVSGSVEVFVGPTDRMRSVGALGAGEVFGEMCLIEPGPRSATVRATTDVECLAASYEEFIDSIETYPDRAVGFMKTLVRRLRQMNELLESQGPEGGLRNLIQKSVGPFDMSRDVKTLAWTMLW